jgi:hypothetical protein
MLFWASLYGDAIQVTRFDPLMYTSLPAFSPSGREFVVTDEGKLYRYAYPNGPLLAQTRRFPEDEHAGEDVCYLNEKHAVLTSAKGKLFIVDALKMKVIDELSLTGVEPRQVSRLIKFSDGRFLSAHRDFAGKNADGVCDRLAVWPAPVVG